LVGKEGIRVLKKSVRGFVQVVPGPGRRSFSQGMGGDRN